MFLNTNAVETVDSFCFSHIQGAFITSKYKGDYVMFETLSSVFKHCNQLKITYVPDLIKGHWL